MNVIINALNLLILEQLTVKRNYQKSMKLHWNQ